MFFRKAKRDTITETFGNRDIPAAGGGNEAGADESPRDVDPLAVLRSTGIDTDLIPDSLLPTITSSFAMNTDDSNDNAKIKVDCASCNRPVAYGRGKCMYCGKPLELPESARAEAASPDDKPNGDTGLDFDLGGSL